MGDDTTERPITLQQLVDDAKARIEELSVEQLQAEMAAGDVTVVDIRSKKARDLFRQRKASALIHMGLLHDRRASPRELYSWNIGGTWHAC